MDRSELALATEAYLLAQGIFNLRDPDFATLNEIHFGFELAPPWFTASGTATDTQPGYFWINNAAKAFLVLDGTLTWTQAIGQAVGYVGSPMDSLSDPQNNYYYNAAAFILDDMRVRQGINWPPIIVVGGWSLGGAVAEYMTWIARQRVPAWNTVKLHTFGSPRPGGPTLSHHINGSCDLTRWFNSNDPVPVVPPHVDEFSAVVVLLGMYGALRAQSFVQPAGGLQIDPSGGMVSRILPSEASVTFGQSLAQWLLDFDIQANEDHYITTYLANLQACLRVASTKAIALAEIEKRSAAGKARLLEEASLYKQAVFALERQQSGAGVVVPPENLFRTVKNGGAWSIEWQDRIVVLCGSRKGARALTRMGNQFLRFLQPRAAVDVSGLTAALEQYLAQATDPAGGFTPRMNTEFP